MPHNFAQLWDKLKTNTSRCQRTRLEDSTTNCAHGFYELGIIRVVRLTRLGILRTIQGLCRCVLVGCGPRFRLPFLVFGKGPDGLQKLK
jgi:hypothetical protein